MLDYKIRYGAKRHPAAFREETIDYLKSSLRELFILLMFLRDYPSDAAGEALNPRQLPRTLALFKIWHSTLQLLFTHRSSAASQSCKLNLL